MLGTKRNAGEMMVCSPQRYPLLTDVNNNMMGQQGDPHNNMERLQGRVRRKKLKLYNNNNSNNTNNDNNNRNRLKRRSAIYDENGTNMLMGRGSYYHNVEQTSGNCVTYKKVRQEDSKDVIKFTQRHLELLSNQHAHKVNELETVVNKQQEILTHKAKELEAVKSENGILKRGVIIQETKNKQLTVEANSYKTLISQMKDHIMKLEQRNYSLQTQLSQRDGMEPFHSNNNCTSFSNHGF